MMTTDIVNEIARLMSQRAVGLKDSKDTKELKAKSDLPEVHDEVNLSETAKSYAGHEASDLEGEQAMKVQRLKALVDHGNYHMDKHMVETIAERIANTLV